MKNSYLVIATFAAAVLADIPTFTSTIVSSSCSLGPSTFKFSNDTLPVTQADTSLEVRASSFDDVIYETDVITNDQIFTTDRVVCHGGSCYTTTDIETWTTTTATIDGVLTTIVTHVPVSSESSKQLETTNAMPTTTTDIETTILTITSCSNEVCKPTAVTTGLTKVTSTVSGETTIFTTYCPISKENESTKTLSSTTVITVSSCSKDVCHSSAVTTGVTQLTTTIHGVESIYTTYCPIESSQSPASKEPSAKEITISETKVVTITSQKAQETQSSAPAGTINVITNNIVTQSSTEIPASKSTSVPLISTYEGGAGRIIPTFLGGLSLLLAIL